MKQRPQPIRGLWRAGCVDEAHVRFGRRAAETGRLRDRHRAAVRPHHVGIRLDEEKLCLLVLIGVRVDGTKELVALADGYRESTGSWADLLRDAKRRGMHAPVLAVGDGALGFWGALREVFPETREQRCWFHRDRKRIKLLYSGAAFDDVLWASAMWFEVSLRQGSRCCCRI